MIVDVVNATMYAVYNQQMRHMGVMSCHMKLPLRVVWNAKHAQHSTARLPWLDSLHDKYVPSMCVHGVYCAYIWLSTLCMVNKTQVFGVDPFQS